MIKKQQGMLKTKCSSGGGGYCCDTECCMLNRWLELLCLLLTLGSFFLPGFSSDTYANAPGTLGVCNIENPTVYQTSSGKCTTASEYNRVYFGYVPASPEGQAINYKSGSTSGTSVSEPYGPSGGVTMRDSAIYWRVLNTVANDTSGTAALFMLTEYGLNKISWDMRNSGSSQWWKTDDNKTNSSLRIFLQGSSCKVPLSHDKLDSVSGYEDVSSSGRYNKGVYDECFEEAEQEAILETINREVKGTNDIKWVNDSNTAYGCGLSGEKLFLLSAQEASKQEYGFSSEYRNGNDYTDTNKLCKQYNANGSNSTWWLRSAYSFSSDTVASVGSSGYSANSNSNYTGVAVRFALNIPLSSVLFAQDANSPASTPSSTFTPIPTSSLDHTRSTDPSLGKGAKLTIVDKSDTSPRRNFWIPQGKYKVARVSASPTNITIPYRHAATGSGEYISAIIKESNDATSYYARLKSLSNPVDTNGTVTMTIPAELPNGSYKLIVMSEKDNGPYRTNYAKNYNLRLYVDENNVTVAGDGAAGVCTIENPTVCETDTGKCITASAYNRVYFGCIPASPEGQAKNAPTNTNDNAIDVDPYRNMKGNALYWRVLNTTANDKTSTPALFMLTEYTLNNISWDARYPNTTNQRWEYLDPDTNTKKTDSSLRVFLQGSSCNATLSHDLLDSYANSDTKYTKGVYDECFDTAEKEVLLATNNGEVKGIDDTLWSNSTWLGYGCGLTGDKIFPLSIKEALNQNYGFSSEHRYGGDYIDINKVCKQYTADGNTSHWWLRSGFSYSPICVAYMDSSGYANYANGNSDCNYPVRFALNIPLSSVLFAQDANSTASTPSPIFTAIPSTLARTKFMYNTSNLSAPAQIYTVEDDHDELCTASTPPGAKLTIVDNSNNFTITQDIARATSGSSINVDYTNASVGDDEYISAIIKDTSGNALYHARLKAVGNNSNGTVSMNIPSELEPGEYMLVIYNELERGSYNTNYAGYDTLILVISDANNPDNENPIMTNVYKNLAGTRFRFTVSDNQELYQVTNSSRAKLRDLSGTKATTNMSCGTQSSIFVEDLAGNTSELQNILTDTTPPTVNISYNNGTYTLTVSDNESGVWKITNSDGTVVYRDYSC